MHASPASASAEERRDHSAPPTAAPSAEAALIVGLNWLGDSLMSMPAIQAWRRAHPQSRLVLLVKRKLAPLWTLQAAIDKIVILPENLGGLPAAVREIAARRCRLAFILPNSFRSALVPFLARVPERVGLSGHSRDWMLTKIVRPPALPGREHQRYEYLALFGLADAPAETPRLQLTPELPARAFDLLGSTGRNWIAVMPGAAYGAAKRWPAERFARAAQMLKERLNCNIVALGSAEEHSLCEIVARGAGPGSLNLAGRTSLNELAAVLAQCKLALGNDSGGMHLAAAFAIPVVAVFGITDPQRTKPLGSAVRVLQDSEQRNRDLRRDSPEARAGLLRITPEQVVAAALELQNR
ncbi:MAG: lipopolysaccharide heptosyltransferase II [Lentisphaerae bacterium]|nr:lipopolysaccharide heptosyltransferase II [Lentisphaerota bacterium]